MKKKMLTAKEYFDERAKRDPEFAKARETYNPEFELGLTFYEARMDKGLTQKDVSEMSGISQADISKIESGERQANIKTLHKIANALGMKITLVPFTK